MNPTRGAPPYFSNKVLLCMPSREGDGEPPIFRAPVAAAPDTPTILDSVEASCTTPQCTESVKPPPPELLIPARTQNRPPAGARGSTTLVGSDIPHR